MDIAAKEYGLVVNSKKSQMQSEEKDIRVSCVEWKHSLEDMNQLLGTI